MDYEAYRNAFFASPPPASRFDVIGSRGITVLAADFEAALDYYRTVFGDPAYVESDDTRGWRLGDTWLTLMPCGGGAPSRNEVSLELSSPAEAERLHAAMIEAGGRGSPPSDQLMYAPIRFCAVTDPHGTSWVLYAPLDA